MRVTFINFNAELSADGSRVLSAILKARGHRVKMLFTPEIGSSPIRIQDDEFRAAFGDTQLFLFSFMSPYLEWAIHATQYVRKILPEVPILWGGVHPTAMPEDCLRYCDIVGRGECDDTLPELVEKMERGEDYRKTQNFWFRDGAEIVENPLRELPVDLDTVVRAPDMQLEDHWILHEGHLQPMSEELFRKHHTIYYFNEPTYICHTDRGCPFVCTYCYNSEWANIYGFQARKIRYRSIAKVIEELQAIKDRYPWYGYVGFSDDDFLHRKQSFLEEFLGVYKEKIGLPFAINVIPNSCHPDKVKLCMDAGLQVVQIGVQSGSERLTKEYKRNVSNTHLMRAVTLFDEYRQKGYKIKINCDFILDNPWETDEDILESIDLFQKFPPACETNLFSLTFYPGTTIYKQALEEGIISDSYDVFTRAFNIQTRREHRYLTYVFLLQAMGNRPLGDRLLKMATSKWARALGNRLPDFLLNGVWGQRVFPRLVSYRQRRSAI